MGTHRPSLAMTSPLNGSLKKISTLNDHTLAGKSREKSEIEIKIEI